MNLQEYSFEKFDDVVQDWSNFPLTSLIVVHNQETCPDSHKELVFSRLWQGSKPACDCVGVHKYSRGDSKGEHMLKKLRPDELTKE